MISGRARSAILFSALLLAACQTSGGRIAAEATPSVEPTATVRYTPIPVQTLAPPTTATFDPRSIKVRFAFAPEVNKDPRWEALLPRAWQIATLNRSRIVITSDVPDVTIAVYPPDFSRTACLEAIACAGDTPEAQRPYFGRYLIAVWMPFEPYQPFALIHELGHVLGCCFGPGTDKGHFVTGEPGIMSHPTCGPCLSAMLLSERELTQMGLAAK